MTEGLDVQSLHGIRARALESVRLPGRKDTKQHSTRRHKQTNTQTNNTRRHNTTRADTTQHAQTQTNKQRSADAPPPHRVPRAHTVWRAVRALATLQPCGLYWGIWDQACRARHTHTHSTKARRATPARGNAGPGRGGERLTRTCACFHPTITTKGASASRARAHHPSNQS